MRQFQDAHGSGHRRGHLLLLWLQLVRAISSEAPTSAPTLAPTQPPTLAPTPGEYLIVDSDNHRVQRCSASTPGAPCTTVAGVSGSAGSSANQLNYPSGIAINEVGDFVIVDSGNHRIQLCPAATPGAACTTVAGGYGQGDAARKFDYPKAIAIDAAGDYVIADEYNCRVQLCPAASPRTDCTTVAGGSCGGSYPFYPSGIAINDAGDYVVSDSINHLIMLCSSGACATVAGLSGQGSGARQLNYPQGITLDAAGDYVIADYNNHRVQLCPASAPGADCATVAGVSGQGDGPAQLKNPTGVAINTDGDYVIADFLNHRIQLCPASAPGTACTTVAGGNGDGDGPTQLSRPRAVLIDQKVHTPAPTSLPTAPPTISPTAPPTQTPTGLPTGTPTIAPTAAPTQTPTASPTRVPTSSPTATPTQAPTLTPTSAPTLAPTQPPTLAPTPAPTPSPTVASGGPSMAPTPAPAPAVLQSTLSFEMPPSTASQQDYEDAMNTPEMFTAFQNTIAVSLGVGPSECTVLEVIARLTRRLSAMVTPGSLRRLSTSYSLDVDYSVVVHPDATTGAEANSTSMALAMLSMADQTSAENSAFTSNLGPNMDAAVAASDPNSASTAIISESATAVNASGVTVTGSSTPSDVTTVLDNAPETTSTSSTSTASALAVSDELLVAEDADSASALIIGGVAAGALSAVILAMVCWLRHQRKEREGRKQTAAEAALPAPNAVPEELAAAVVEPQDVKVDLRGEGVLAASGARLSCREASELSGVSAFWVLCQFPTLARDRTRKKNPTFHDMCKVLAYGNQGLGFGKICPRDGRPNCSVVDALDERNRGMATDFVSWCWNYTLDDFVSAVSRYVEQSGLDARDVYLWVCFFCNNQYRIFDEHSKNGADNLEELFERRLVSIGRMVIILDRFTDPGYITRLWCIFESYVAVTTGIPIELTAPDAAVGEMEHKTVSNMKECLNKMDARTATASFKADEDKIKNLIATTIGFETVNSQVKDLVASRIIAAYTELMSRF